MREEVQNLISQLEILSSTELDLLFTDTSGEIGKDVMENAIATVITRTATNPIGNAYIFRGMEIIKEKLNYLKTLRLHLIKNISKVSEISHWIEDVAAKEVKNIQDEDLSVSRSTFIETTEAIQRFFSSSFELFEKQYAKVLELLSISGRTILIDGLVVDAVNIDSTLQHFLEKACVHAAPAVVQEMDSEIVKIVQLITDSEAEKWIAERINTIFLKWNSADGKNVVLKVE